MRTAWIFPLTAGCVTLLLAGCEGDPRQPQDNEASRAPLADTLVLADAPAIRGGRGYAPVQLGGGTSPATNAPAANPAGTATVRQALKPLQVVVGTWRGNTFRDNAVHDADVAWDHKTDPARPALRMTAEKNPFFTVARLSYRPADSLYVLTLTEPDGGTRRLEGDFEEPPAETIGDDGRTLQRTYKLALEQVEPAGGEQWRVVLNQQENNRFLMDLSRRRGKAAFRKFDTVSEQRQGTSFALSDEGYGEKTCLISGGLGTIAVSHAGKTYWVCCSGCKAAFEDDPEKWIAEAAKAKAAE